MNLVAPWNVESSQTRDGTSVPCNAGDLGSIPGLGRSPGEGNGHSSILAWRFTKSQSQLSDFHIKHN